MNIRLTAEKSKSTLHRQYQIARRPATKKLSKFSSENQSRSSTLQYLCQCASTCVSGTQIGTRQQARCSTRSKCSSKNLLRIFSIRLQEGQWRQVTRRKMLNAVQVCLALSLAQLNQCCTSPYTRTEMEKRSMTAAGQYVGARRFRRGKTDQMLPTVSRQQEEQFKRWLKNMFPNFNQTKLLPALPPMGRGEKMKLLQW